MVGVHGTEPEQAILSDLYDQLGACIESHHKRPRQFLLNGVPCNDSEPVVLDFVQPLAAGRELIGFGREARRDEPGRTTC